MSMQDVDTRGCALSDVESDLSESEIIVTNNRDLSPSSKNLSLRPLDLSFAQADSKSDGRKKVGDGEEDAILLQEQLRTVIFDLPDGSQGEVPFF